MKSLFIIILAIISGISAYFAFPGFFSLVALVLGPSIYPDYRFHPILLYAPCVVVPFPVYYAFTYRDVKRIQTPKKTQAIIVFTASLPWIVFVGASLKGPMSWLLWTIAVLLNQVFFSTIALLSLYYLLRTALEVKRQQAAKDNLP